MGALLGDHPASLPQINMEARHGLTRAPFPLPCEFAEVYKLPTSKGLWFL